jgi:hypothetical protein
MGCAGNFAALMRNFVFGVVVWAANHRCRNYERRKFAGCATLSLRTVHSEL